MGLDSNSSSLSNLPVPPRSGEVSLPNPDPSSLLNPAEGSFPKPASSKPPKGLRGSSDSSPFQNLSFPKNAILLFFYELKSLLFSWSIKDIKYYKTDHHNECCEV